MYVGTLSISDWFRYGCERGERGGCEWKAVLVSGDRPPPWEAEALHYLPQDGGQVRSRRRCSGYALNSSLPALNSPLPALNSPLPASDDDELLEAFPNSLQELEDLKDVHPKD